MDTFRKILTPNQYAKEQQENTDAKKRTYHCNKININTNDVISAQLKERRKNNTEIPEDDLRTQIISEIEDWEKNCITSGHQKFWLIPDFKELNVEEWIKPVVNKRIRDYTNTKILNELTVFIDDNELGRGGAIKSINEDDIKKNSKRKKSSRTRMKPTRKYTKSIHNKRKSTRHNRR